jgi:predicted ArsR family transcriptional regulator
MKDPATVRDPLAAIGLLAERNRRRLYELVVSRDEALGRDDAAAALEISRELAAFHLDQLVAGGLLETEFKRRGGRTGPGAGRPAKFYRRSAQDITVALPARDYERAAEVFADGLERLPGRSGVEAVAGVARERGLALGLEARRRAGRRPGRRRLRETLVELLRRAGYEPDVEAGMRSIALRSCPYAGLTVGHRELTCGMNLAWAQGVASGIAAGLEAERVDATDRCCVEFRASGSRGS